MAFLLPLGAFLCGVLLAHMGYGQALKRQLSTLLARVLIPIVIIYNMVFYQSGSLSLMLFSFSIAVILFYSAKYCFKDALQALSLSYMNLAWLGFPFALALFGPEVSAAMVALYVGGSVFGNIWAVFVLSPSQSGQNMLYKVLQSPPIVALLIAALARICGVQHWQAHQFLDLVYSVAKIGMSFAGMCVLGMWLSQTQLHWADLKRSSTLAVYKLAVGAVLCGMAWLWIPIPAFKSDIGVMFLLFCLPPAANIVALETHYRGSGKSAQYIASGTVVSCGIILIYGLLLHL